MHSVHVITEVMGWILEPLLNSLLDVLNFVDNSVVDCILSVVESEFCTLLGNLDPSSMFDFFCLGQSELLSDDFELHIFLVLLEFYLHLLHVGCSLFLCFSKSPLNNFITSVWVSKQRCVCRWSSESFPVTLTELLEGPQVVFLIGLKLTTDYLYLMSILRLVTGTKKEHKSLSLLWRQTDVSEIKVNLRYSVSIVDSGGGMLSGVIDGVLCCFPPPREVRWVIFLLLHHLSLRSQRVVKRISYLFLQPVWDLSVTFVRFAA
jgi:hypothetical protein